MAALTARSVAATRKTELGRFRQIIDENTRRFYGVSAGD
jgi:hypothetical protein